MKSARGLATLLLALTLAAACGGSEKKSTAEPTPSATPAEATEGGKAAAKAWLSKVCPAIKAYTGPKEPEVAENASLADRRNALVGFYDAGAKTTEQLVRELEAAGEPEMQNGKEIAAAWKGAFDGLAQAFAKAKTDAEGLSTTDEDAFVTAAVKITDDLEKSLLTMAETLKGLREGTVPSADLEAVVDEVPECADVLR